MTRRSSSERSCTATWKAKFGPEDERSIVLLSYLGWSCILAGDLGRAVSLLEEADRLWISTKKADSLQRAETVSILGIARRAEGDLDRAGRLWEEALRIVQAKPATREIRGYIEYARANLAHHAWLVGDRDRYFRLNRESAESVQIRPRPGLPGTACSA